LPNYARPGHLGAWDYDIYLREFVETVQPFAISYDHYHFTQKGDGARFFENLQAVRDVAREKHLPFWNIVLCVQHGQYRNLTEPELRFEAMQSLAFGAKGLLWFTYWTPESDKTFAWQHAMINADGSRDPHYQMIKEINADVLSIGGELLRARPLDVYDARKMPSDAPLVVSPAEMTVGL